MSTLASPIRPAPGCVTWFRSPTTASFLERPIFVGGTGLYFRALEEGISEMPDIPNPIRERWRYELAEKGADKLHRVLMREDPQVAMMLRAGDGQRIVRALEVLEASGRSILEWQAERGKPLIDRESARFIVIEPDRAELVARIDRRFDGMIGAGALEEVKALAAQDLDPQLPAMKAIGVRELQCRDQRRNSAWPRRSNAPRSRPGNMPSASRPGSAISWVRTGGASGSRMPRNSRVSKTMCPGRRRGSRPTPAPPRINAP